MFAQFVEQIVIALKSGHDVEGQISLARGESGEEPIGFTPTGIFVMIAAEADDAVAPMMGFEPVTCPMSSSLCNNKVF